MTKNKKKRNKVYSGADAAVVRPIITHISAANRSKLGQWLFEHKKIIKPILIAVGVVTFIIIIIIEIVRISSGG
ncbi:MAG TPA: hypothetical protein VFD55_01030 [Candidatus Angelobacter sp.]|nr:hypothetical protein [Candidatus Angelobacter sp.]